jgi:asparagine synthase (glutamine-hydrolysing)
MCGICGFFDRQDDSSRTEAELVAMGETIRHRGPDSHGSTVHRGVGLHSRRLKIIDLEGGDQPIFSEDGKVAVVYNGEIFNFQELRSDLQAKGYRFRTKTDTEVLVYLYQEYGADGMLPRLNGFFAFALHDRAEHRVLVARDRLGVKPLYYAETQRGLVFGSELKTLQAEGSLDQSVDPTALVDFLALRYIPAPKTIFSAARKLPAGHYLLYNGRHLQLEQWWDLPEFGTRQGSPAALADELWELLKDSVRCRLISDVPLGAFLSGGLDSSAVVTAMHQLQGKDVTAVSIGFENWDQSELHHAEKVAANLGITHISDVLQPQVVSLVEPLAYFFDEPFADPSAIPTYLLAKRTRQEVTVALSGDGGDECYAGYRRYRFDQMENQVRGWLPGPLFRGIFSLAGKVYPKADFLPQPLRARSTLQNLGRDPLQAYVRSVGHLPVEEVRRLLRPEIRAQVEGYDPVENFRSWFERAPVRDPLSRVQYLDFHTYLPDYIMCKTDRATMAHSLEAREPLLDYRLVEFAASLSPDLKLRGGVVKWILKQAVEPYLPKSTLQRPKQGFHPPLKSWVAVDLREKLQQMPVPSWLDAQQMKHCIRHHQEGRRDHSELLYSTLVLRAFEERTAAQPVPEGVGSGV